LAHKQTSAIARLTSISDHDPKKQKNKKHGSSMHHNSSHKLAAKFHPEASSSTIQVTGPREIFTNHPHHLFLFA
jgi:hypothetical protein